MAGASLLALIDDITTVLDDVSILTKVAAKKTAGVVGDDLALNAQQVVGIDPTRELPVVWAVAKGSLLNKAILVPAALLISWLAPWAVTPLLMLGGLFLCYEGVEKLAHRYLHANGEAAAHEAELARATVDPAVDLVALEKDKIKGAIRTDFILSAEIIAITLGTVATAPFATRVLVLTGIALAMTVGVYGLVAGIVKLDDAGLHLSRRPGDGLAAVVRATGRGILAAAPYLMKFLSVAGTIAMFLVGGGIIAHGIHALGHWIEGLAAAAAAAVPGAGGVLKALVPLVGDLLVGVIAGAIVVAVVEGAKRLRRRRVAPSG